MIPTITAYKHLSRQQCIHCIVAIVCSVIVAVSFVVERSLHYGGKYLKKKKDQKPLFQALQKINEELMLMGFISLLLTVTQNGITKICVHQSWTRHMLPCKKESETATSHFQRHLLAAKSGDRYCASKVAGVQQTYHQFHHDSIPRVFSPKLAITILGFVGRMLVRIPKILIVKFCSKALAKWTLPVVSNTLGIPIKSTSYIPTLKGSFQEKKSDKLKQAYLQKLLS